MGVGDDESLDGSISITVIATGFDADQQHEITNTESKKIIHTLDAEQKAEQDLTAKVTASTVAIPEETTAEIVKEAEAVKIIRHSLFEEDAIEVKAPAPVSKSIDIPFEGFIDTSELIKNIDVVSEEVCIHHIAEFDQLVINEIDVNSFEVVVPAAKVVKETISVTKEIRAEKEAITTADDVEFTINEKLQEIEGKVTQEGLVNDKTIAEAEDQMLMFDMPMHAAEEITNVKRHELQREEKEEEVLTSVIQDIEVHDHVEIVPVSEVTKEGVKMYSLDDYEEKEEQLFNAKPTEKNSAVEEEIKFETRTIDTPATPRENVGIDPMNTPISKLLKDRTEERKRKMKDFNYKVRNSASKLDEIERQPAYKRMGIELEEARDETTLSRTSVNTEDDGVDLRSNNSFLHDNVD
jgi:cell division protein FtsZ